MDKLRKIFVIFKSTIGLEEQSLKCPRCKKSQWIEGPSGGGSVNILCSSCGSKYNHTPFGLDDITDKETLKRIEREKKIDKLIK